MGQVNVNRKHMTAAMIDSHDYLDAKRKTDLEPLLPTGMKIAFTGRKGVNDTATIWASLDKVRTKHNEMVRLHGGSARMMSSTQMPRKRASSRVIAETFRLRDFVINMMRKNRY